MSGAWVFRGTYWDYARVLGSAGDPADQYETALRKTLELNPEMLDARIRLGQELYRKNKYVQALLVLREMKRIEPERASPVFLMMAYCAVQGNVKDEAKRYAEIAQKHAHTTEELNGARRMLDYLEQKDQGKGAPTLTAVRMADGSETPVAFADHHLTAKGRLTQLDCIGEVARMHIKLEASTTALLIRQPGQVRIRNAADGATVNLTCGAQDTLVSVDYLPAFDDKYSTLGDVRAIEFLK